MKPDPTKASGAAVTLMSLSLVWKYHQIITSSRKHYRHVNLDNSHRQDFDIHNLLPELPAGGGVVLKGTIIVSQIPEEINRVTVRQTVHAEIH